LNGVSKQELGNENQILEMCNELKEVFGIYQEETVF